MSLVRIVVLVFASVALWTETSAGQCSPKAGSQISEMFASVTDVLLPFGVAGNKSLRAGIELRLNEESGSVSATLMDYEGDETPLKTKLKGSIREQIGGACKVRLSGRNRRGRVEIEGAIGSATFDG